MPAHMPSRRPKRPDGRYYRDSRRQSLRAGGGRAAGGSGGLSHRRRGGFGAPALWFNSAALCLLVLVATTVLSLVGTIHSALARPLLIGSGAGFLLAAAAFWMILRE